MSLRYREHRVYLNQAINVTNYFNAKACSTIKFISDFSHRYVGQNHEYMHISFSRVNQNEAVSFEKLLKWSSRLLS